MEMAADFPKPNYVGVDIVPVFPKSTYPSNIEFFQHNFLDGLPYENNTFDYIHMQALVFDFTTSQWETFVYKELARLLKPGGWLEISDPHVAMVNAGPTLKKLQDACKKLRNQRINIHQFNFEILLTSFLFNKSYSV